MDELDAALRAHRRHERARRARSCATSTACPRDKIDLIPHGIPTLPLDAPQQGPARRRGQVGHPHVRAALAGQGHRVRHRRAAGDPRAPSRDRLHRARRDAPARQGAARRDLPAHARGARAAARRRREHDLPQSLRQPGRARRVPRARPTSTSRRTSRPSRSPRARSPTRSARARPSSRRRIATRASCSPTGAASSCRGAIRRRSRARSSTLLGDDAQARARCSERAAAYGREHGVAGRRAQLRRELRARARRRTPSRLRTALPGARRSRRARPSCPRSNLEHLRAHDRRHRHAAARDASTSRATTTATASTTTRARCCSMTLIEDAGTEDARGRPRARVALPRVREPRLRRDDAGASATS